MGAYLMIQALDGNVLVPLLFSEVVNLHPIAIIVAILIFGGLWGFWGVFFAIPLATLVQAVLNAWPTFDGRRTDDSQTKPARLSAGFIRPRSSVSGLQLPVADQQARVIFAQTLGQALHHVDRAVSPTGAADRHGQVGTVLPLEAGIQRSRKR